MTISTVVIWHRKSPGTIEIAEFRGEVLIERAVKKSEAVEAAFIS